MADKITINLSFNEAAEFVVELSQTAAEYLKAEDFDPLWTPQQTNDFVVARLSDRVEQAVENTAHVTHPDGHTTHIDISGRHLKAA
jgi:hypothetical protein